MDLRLLLGLRRRLGVALALTGVITATIGTPAPGTVAARPPALHRAAAPATPPPGTDLTHLDTHREHYTQGANGQIHLRLYDSPVGVPTTSGFRLRDPKLTAPTSSGDVTPAGLPFGLRFAATSGGSALASLTSEDGVTLDVGLRSVAATPPAAVTGLIAGNAITYPAPAGAGQGDVALRATTAGLDVRLIIRNASESGQFTLALTPDPRATLAQDANGTIEATRPITAYGDGGTPYVTEQTEYVVEAPNAFDSSGTPAALAPGAPVTMALGPAGAGPATVSVALDPAWLRAAGRAFPVYVDVPIVTAYSAVNTGLAGTVSSCAPAQPAPHAPIVVGTANGCTYHGLLYFDTNAINPAATIISATLHLATPDATGPTSVQIYPNAYPTTAATGTAWQPVAWQPPSWDSAPAVSGTVGLAQSGSAGHDQSWDVTALVDRWVHVGRTNGGLTLESASAPVLFASELGAGLHSPDQTPYLDVTYAPPGSATASAPGQGAAPLYSDGGYSIYGIAGPYGTGCTQSIQCSGVSPVDGQTYKAFAVNQAFSIGSQYVRLTVYLKCQSQAPGATWWNSWGPAKTSAGEFNDGSIYALMKNAYNDGLIPIVTFRQPDCSTRTPFPNSVWLAQIQDFVNNMTAGGLPKPLPMTYFEIGNEFNVDTTYNGGYPSNPPCNNCDYPSIFSASAYYLSQALDQRDGNSTAPYRILTAGTLQPTASTGCRDVTGTANNISLAYDAIASATAYPYYMPKSRLGVAVHPYSYDTYEPYGNYWKNFYHEYGVYVPQDYTTFYNTYNGQCADLGNMINLWNSANYFNGLPIVFTEENWASYPCTYGTNTPGGGVCGYYCSSTAGCEGTFLADLFTWLADHNGYAQSTSPLRVLWFTGIDFPVGSTGLTNTNGIYGMPATNTSPPREKAVTVNTCPQYANYIQGQHNLSGDYYSLSSGGYCY